MIYCTLGEILEALGMTRKDFALKTGIGINTINRYCNNTWLKFDKDHMKIICEYLNCPLETLIRYFPMNEGTDEESFRKAIKYRLLQEQFSRFVDDLPPESQIKIGYTPSDK